MPIKEKEIEVFNSSGDQHGESSYHVWFNLCGESTRIDNQVYSRFRLNNREAIDKINELIITNYQENVQASDLDTVCYNIHQAIIHRDTQKLKSLLSADFIYPGKVASYHSNNPHNKGEWSDYGTETYRVRPMCEALFVDNFMFFSVMINKLIEMNDERLYQAFLQSLDNTELKDPSLFLWNEAIQTKVLGQLNELRNQGDSLSKKEELIANNKGNRAVKLANHLSEEVSTRIPQEPTCNKERFENFAFKLGMIEKLHRNDELFNTHRGWKRFVANFFSILCSIGIANFIRYKITGNGFFCNTTWTQEKISHTQRAMGFNTEEKINFVKSL